MKVTCVIPRNSAVMTDDPRAACSASALYIALPDVIFFNPSTIYLMTDPSRGWPLLFPLQSLKYPFSQLSWIMLWLSWWVTRLYTPEDDNIRTLCSTQRVPGTRPRGQYHQTCWGRRGNSRDPSLIRNNCQGRCDSERFQFNLCRSRKVLW